MLVNVAAGQIVRNVTPYFDDIIKGLITGFATSSMWDFVVPWKTGKRLNKIPSEYDAGITGGSSIVAPPIQTFGTFESHSIGKALRHNRPQRRYYKRRKQHKSCCCN